MILKKGIFTLALLTAVSPIYAMSWPHIKGLHPIIAIGAGGSLSSDAGQSQNFPIADPTTDEFYNYSADHVHQTSLLLNAMVGAEWNIYPRWLLQTGLEYNQRSPYSVNGTLVQGADSLSENTYSYQYNIQSNQLLVDGKLLYTYKQILHPYGLVGLGVGFNRASSFSTNVPPTLTFTRQYSNHTETSFSYALGVGVDVDVTKSVRVGIGYRFADLGKVSLGNATIDTTSVSGSLSQSDLYSNELLAQVTWIVC